MKAILLLVVAAATVIDAATIFADEPLHNLTLGIVEKNDWILWSREVVQKGSWLPWSTVETTFEYIVPALPSDSQITISAVEALDQGPTGKGGYAKLVSGGVNENHVSLKFTSQKWWRGIDFLVVIYGKVPS